VHGHVTEIIFVNYVVVITSLLQLLKKNVTACLIKSTVVPQWSHYSSASTLTRLWAGQRTRL
jgi:hypothetical protein